MVFQGVEIAKFLSIFTNSSVLLPKSSPLISVNDSEVTNGTKVVK